MRLKTTTVAAAAGALLFAVPAQAREPVPTVCYQTSSYWVPARITNAKAGDTILTRGANGVAGTILATMGQWYTHAGMVTNTGSNIRHNTMDPDKIELDKNWIGAVKGWKGGSLENGYPGIITDTTDQGCGLRNSSYFSGTEKSFNCNTSDVLVKPYNSADYSKVNVALGKMNYMQGHYRLYAYTNIYQLPYSNVKTAGKGNMCSGTVWLSHYYAGNGVSTMAYTAAARQTGAQALFNWTKDQLADQTGWFKRSINALLSLNFNMRTDMANQLVNCMTFNDCGNRSDRWKNGVGTGTSVSPDNLMDTAWMNPSGNYTGKNNPTGVLGLAEPVQKSGGYYQTYQVEVPCSGTNPQLQ